MLILEPKETLDFFIDDLNDFLIDLAIITRSFLVIASLGFDSLPNSSRSSSCQSSEKKSSEISSSSSLLFSSWEILLANVGSQHFLKTPGSVLPN